MSLSDIDVENRQECHYAASAAGAKSGDRREERRGQIT
jgi:hypothetical protein